MLAVLRSERRNVSFAFFLRTVSINYCSRIKTKTKGDRAGEQWRRDEGVEMMF